MKKIHKILFLFAVTTMFSLLTFAQSNIVTQSFEGAGTWTYSEFPNPYTVYSPPSDIWGILLTLKQDIFFYFLQWLASLNFIQYTFIMTTFVMVWMTFIIMVIVPHFNIQFICVYKCLF
mgnify:CR=1 FL=1